MEKQILTESKSWGLLKDSLLEGITADKKNTMGILFENTRRALLSESASFGATSASNIASVNKIILPMIRRVMPTIIANEIMGVIPMTGPVGQIPTLRVIYNNTVPADGTGVVKGTEALSPFELAKYYTGNEDIANPDAAQTALLEGRLGNRVAIQILKETVEAKSHRMSAVWTSEAMQDAQSQYGINIENEIFAAVAKEMTVEIDQIMLSKCRALATTVATYDQATVSGNAITVVDQHAALAVLINMMSNNIAAKTRKGPGNWAVTNATGLTILQSARASSFARTTEGTLEAPTNVKYVGTLNSALKVYADTYGSDEVLIGYKGSQESDAGNFYCPYVPLVSSGTNFNPETAELLTSFLTRYGYVEMTNTASSLGNSSDYFSKVKIQGAKFF